MKRHVLIVHKNARDLRRLRELFVRDGYQIMTATNWATARRIRDSFDIELVVCAEEDLRCDKPGGKEIL